MEQLKMHSVDGVTQNVERIAALFPNCVTERKGENGEVERAIDFDMLRQELSRDIIDTGEERYQFTWPGKREAIRLANAPTNCTLRPVRDDSVDFDNTQNLYIEGDNLEVLKLLRETYLGKVKMIYIDPPYNTGNDFVYEDDFAQSYEDFKGKSGMFDENGNMLLDNYERNIESKGRFHTDWLNMIYPRLKVARDLLADDGVIFISIDDKEIENLRKVCNEIFGDSNFVSNIVWQSTAGSNTGTDIVTVTENIVVYTKNRQLFQFDGMLTKEESFTLSDEYEATRGKYSLDKLDRRRVGNHYSDALNYPIEMPDGSIRYPGGGSSKPTDGWNYLWSQTKVKWGIENGFIVFKKVNGEWNVYNKRYSKIDNEGNFIERTIPFRNLILSDKSNTAQGTAEQRVLFDFRPFDFPKPSGLIHHLLLTAVRTSPNALVLDFFSGSATTAHAVMQLNAEDGGNRKFIMVQLPEVTEEKSEARKAGYANICEIGKERIRRAGKRIKSEMEQKANSLSREIDRMLHAKPSTTAQLLLKDQLKEIAENIYKEQILPKQKELDEVERQLETLDIGFRVLRLDSSNMEDVYYTPDKFDPTTLTGLLDNVKSDRTDEDLLFQVMLELDVPLSASIKQEQFAGKSVFVVADGHLIATFDKDVNESTVTEIAKRKPNFFVMRDASAANDNVLDNFEQIFRHYSPDTICKIL